MLVQEMRDLNFRFAGHRFPPEDYFVGGGYGSRRAKESDIAAR